MDLDELKYQLKQKLGNDHTGRSAEDMALLLTKKTVSITDKLKKSLWIEVFFSCIFAVIFLYTGMMSSLHSLRIYFSVFGFVAIAFLILVIYLLNKISRLSRTTLPVKSNLQTIVNIIEEFMKRNFQFTMALIPICLIFSIVLGYTDTQTLPTGNLLAKSHLNAVWQLIIVIVLYMILVSTGIYFFTKWYLKKLYGKYITQLKECIEELKEE